MSVLEMNLETETAPFALGLDHETVLPTGPVNQEFTFTWDGSVISVEPPLPQDIARKLVGEEWQFIKAARQEGADATAPREVKGFRHHAYYYNNVLPCQEVVNVFFFAAKAALIAGGNYPRFVRAS